MCSLSLLLERKLLPELVWSTRAAAFFLSLLVLILDSLECQSSGSVVMRNAKNPNCLDLAKVPEQKTSERDRDGEKERGGGTAGSFVTAEEQTQGKRYSMCLGVITEKRNS